MDKLNTQTSRSTFLTPREVANMLHVDPKTVTRWASSGKIESIRTPGGHRRFRREIIAQILAGDRVINDDDDEAGVRNFVHWLVALGDPANATELSKITLANVIERAKKTLSDDARSQGDT